MKRGLIRLQTTENGSEKLRPTSAYIFSLIARNFLIDKIYLILKICQTGTDDRYVPDCSYDEPTNRDAYGTITFPYSKSLLRRELAFI